MAELEQVLSRVFGHSELRPGQEEVIRAVLDGRPTLAVMPTGAGKSLCYQLPALLIDGLTLVVSPLVALMRDQVHALTSRGVAAAALTHLDPHAQRRETEARLNAGELDILYVAPERLCRPSFLRRLADLNLAQIAVDEAHCISEWGHDFRPDYARLGDAIKSLAPPRLLALTATATPEVQQDILRVLAISKAKLVITGFDRDNLELEVAQTPRREAKTRRLVEELKDSLGPTGSAIVYVNTRKASAQVADELTESGFDASAYHAGLDSDRRRQVERRFEAESSQVVVATNAFGMGVDKADVRAVVHYHVPSSVEAYYQEVGRAGRDGAPARGLMLFGSADLRLAYRRLEAATPTPEAVAEAHRQARAFEGQPMSLDALVAHTEEAVGVAARAAFVALEQAGDIELRHGSVEVLSQHPSVSDDQLKKRAEHERGRLDAIIGYVTRASCRRRYLVSYFEGQEGPPCEVCDRCTAPPQEALSEEQQRAAMIAMSCVARMRGRFGKGRVVEVLLGSKSRPVLSAGLDSLSTYGMLSTWTKTNLQSLLDALLRADLVRMQGRDYPQLALTEQGATALKTQAELSLDWQPTTSAAGRSTGSTRSRSSADEPPLEPAAQQGFDMLRAWRTAQAKEEGKPPYVVAPDKLLRAVASERPETRAQLLALPGMGPARWERYGLPILEIVAAIPSA